MNSPARKHTPARESALLDFVRQLSKTRSGIRAAHIHLSRLRPYNRQDHHLLAAASVMDRLIVNFDGAMFQLFNKDLVVICNGATLAQVDGAITRLRQLFSEDPLLSGEEEVGQEFCSLFDLERDYPQFLSLAEHISAGRMRRDSEREARARGTPVSEPSPGKPIEPPQLAAIEAAIAQADLSNMLKRQPICAFVKGARPEPMLHEVYFSINSLRETLIPDADMLANGWLFQDLSRHLDKRMFALLTRHEDSGLRKTLGLSLNLSIASLLSPEFLEFDEIMRGKTQRTMVVELQLVDVFADIGSFTFARDFLHDRGYRLCLDGATHQSLPFVDRKRLGFDLVKVRWSSDLYDHQTPARRKELCQVIQDIAPERMILCRCDSPRALEVGSTLGIAMYQGRYLDKLLAQQPDKQDPAEEPLAGTQPRSARARA